ncbi:MAG: hypothetical protein MUF87_19290 [Anaerolineae bacterium]|jgi:hypothetical protein|nr:hypothetical protein [Anaerolineae bacterium]
MSATILFNQALDYREREPERARMLFQQVRALAEENRDYCFVLECDYWIWECTIWYMHDYQGAMDLTVRMLMEARKPQYAECLTDLADIHYTIAATYINYDPVGYEQEARTIIDYVEFQMQPGYELWCILSSIRATLEMLLERWDEALQQALICLARSDRTNYRLAAANIKLCDIYAAREEWDLMLSHAEQAEHYAREDGEVVGWLGEALLWQAYAAARSGDLIRADHLFQQHLRHLVPIQDRLDSDYSDVACRYYEWLGQWEQVWELRERDLALALRGGSPDLITKTYRKRIAWLRQRGLPYEAEYQAATQAAQRLRKPEVYLARLKNDLK